MVRQFSLWRWVLPTGLLFVLAAAGCRDSAPVEPLAVTPDTQPDPCADFRVIEPAEGATVTTKPVLVNGDVTPMGTDTVYINDQPVRVENGQFEGAVDLDDGPHQIRVQCGEVTVTRDITVQALAPFIIIEQPVSGALIQESDQPLQVSGRVENAAAVRQLALNGQTVVLALDGTFTAAINPRPGMNHVDLVASLLDGSQVDQRHSFLYGQFTEWTDERSARVNGVVTPSAFVDIARSLEQQMTDEYVASLLEPYLGRDGDLEIQEVQYDRIEVSLVPDDGRMKARLKLHDMGIRFTYHYEVIGVGGRVRGWARARPADVEADVLLILNQTGSYDLMVDNPRVDLVDFEVELDDLYALAEGIVEPLVSNLGQAALVDALNDVVFEDLLASDLLEQEVELLGKTTTVRVNIETLDLSPDGIALDGYAAIDTFGDVHTAVGFWTYGGMPGDFSVPYDVNLGLGIDLFNRLFGEAWRGGIMDLDVSELLGDDSGVSVGLLAGAAGPGLLETFDPAGGLEIETVALMQPIIEIANPETGELILRFGALRLKISSRDLEGEVRHWATVEASLDLNVLPRFDRGELTLESSLLTKIELVERPVFEITETTFEGFLETLLNGAASNALNDFVNEVFRFADSELFGLQIGGVQYGDTAGNSGFLTIGIDLIVSPPQPQQ